MTHFSTTGKLKMSTFSTAVLSPRILKNNELLIAFMMYVLETFVENYETQILQTE